VCECDQAEEEEPGVRHASEQLARPAPSRAVAGLGEITV
jgi:hypothetical protein